MGIKSSRAVWPSSYDTKNFLNISGLFDFCDFHAIYCIQQNQLMIRSGKIKNSPFKLIIILLCRQFRFSRRNIFFLCLGLLWAVKLISILYTVGNKTTNRYPWIIKTIVLLVLLFFEHTPRYDFLQGNERNSGYLNFPFYHRTKLYTLHCRQREQHIIIPGKFDHAQFQSIIFHPSPGYDYLHSTRTQTMLWKFQVFFIS